MLKQRFCNGQTRSPSMSAARRLRPFPASAPARFRLRSPHPLNEVSLGLPDAQLQPSPSARSSDEFRKYRSSPAGTASRQPPESAAATRISKNTHAFVLSCRSRNAPNPQRAALLQAGPGASGYCVAPHSRSNPARSRVSSLRSAGSFIVTSPCAPSIPSITM